MTDEGKTNLDPKDTPPWLMPVSDDDAETEEGGLNMGKLISIAAITFVVFSVAGLIYLYKGYSDADQPAKRIAADSKPVKKKPESPGGKDIPDQDKKVFDQMQGRGNKSGSVDIKRQPEEPLKKIPEKQLVKKDPVVKKEAVVKTANKPAAKKPVSAKPAAIKPAVKKPTPKKVAPASVSGQKYDFYRVQLGSFRNEKAAKVAWRRIKKVHSNLTADMQDYIHPAVVGGKTYYRLSIGPLVSRPAADNTCLYFKTRDQACFVVSPSK